MSFHKETIVNIIFFKHLAKTTIIYHNNYIISTIYYLLSIIFAPVFRIYQRI